MSEALLAAVADLPARSVLCFVGVEEVPAPETVTDVQLTGPRAASTDSGVATANFTTPGVLALWATSARRVVHDGRAHDFEVVLMPGTRWRHVGRARSGDLVVDLLVEVSDGASVAHSGSAPAPDLRLDVAQALVRDRAHEPHPGLPAGRFQGGLVPSPSGTWDPDRLESAERPDFASMSSEEVVAWYATRAQLGRAVPRRPGRPAQPAEGGRLPPPAPGPVPEIRRR